MPIDKDALAVGLKLTGTYKKEDHELEVLASEEEGEFSFRLDGKKTSIFKSLSAAAMAVMDGKSANGWRFWGIPGVEAKSATKGEKAAKEPKAKAEKKATPRTRAASTPPQISLARQQKDAPEGTKRYFCSACMKSFFHPDADGAPTQCPEGHAARVDPKNDDFAHTPAEPKAAATTRKTKVSAVAAPANTDTEDDETGEVDELFADADAEPAIA